MRILWFQLSYKLDLSKLVSPKSGYGFQRSWSLKSFHKLGVMFMLMRSYAMPWSFFSNQVMLSNVEQFLDSTRSFGLGT